MKQLVTLAPEFAMEPVAQVVNLEMGVADYLMDLFTLGRC